MIRRILACGLFAAVLAGAVDFRLKDEHGRTISLARYKGKVVLLNFWATWCHGCVQEIPWLMEYQSRYKREGLVVIGVSMDGDGWKSVRPYLQQKKLNYPVVIGSEQLAQQFGLENMPMTLLYGRDGKVAATHMGMVDRAGCEEEIQKLLR
jgi:peroxiredoxin